MYIKIESRRETLLYSAAIETESQLKKKKRERIKTDAFLLFAATFLVFFIHINVNILPFRFEFSHRKLLTSSFIVLCRFYVFVYN